IYSFRGIAMARSQAKLALLLAIFALSRPVVLLAQGTTLTVGPLTVTLPPGWTRNDFFGTVKYFSPDSTPQQFLRIQFLPAEETTKSAAQRHSEIIGNLASIVRPGTTQQNGVTGNFIWSKIEVQLPSQPPQTMIIYSAKAGSTYVAIGLETDHPDMLARNLPAVEAMLARASLK